MNILQMFSYPFMQRALIAGVLVSLCAALLGVPLVLKRYSMIGDGLSHVSFGALAIAVALGVMPLYFSIPVVILAAFFLLRMASHPHWNSDAAIAAVSASALAIGILVISRTTGMTTDVDNYMFGSVLAMTKGDVALSVILSVTVLAGMATLATLVVAWSAPAQAGEALYVAGCSLTGVGTAFVALRLGSVYSTVGARQAFMYTAGSFIFAGMLYFVCIGLPQPVGLLMAASLPLLAVVFTMAAVRAPSEPAEDVVPVRELPRGYFIRLVVAVSVFSVIAGVIKGFMALQQPLSAATDQGVIIVFATACAAVLLFVLVGLLVREFDISQLYYPIIILTCLGNLVVPLFGGLGVIQGELVSIAYNLFILMVWCLLANVANRTNLSYVRVFGWGRGASAAGTTVGWFAGASLAPVLVENPSNMVALAMGMVFVLLVVSMVILNERTIGMALRKTRNAQTDQGTGDFFPSGRGPEGAGGASDGDGAPREGAWTKSCNALAEQAGLSLRERDVLFLLGKGYTIEYIAGELGISFNTAKSHIRNVYAKAGVHSKQELQSLIEDGKIVR